MLTQLLKNLFGAGRPSDLAQAARIRWEAWLQPIDASAPTGQDPTYHDDFQTIREEVAKLSDIDDTLIINAAERLLTGYAKDVRVAAYYAYARMRRDGAEGLAQGFELLAALIDRFGDSLLPARPASRKAGIEWLAGNTFARRLDALQDLDGTLLERSLSAIALIGESTATWPDSARPELGPLCLRFESRVKVPTATTPTSPDTALASMPSAADTIASSHDMLERARQMATFLRDQPTGQWAAGRLMRCVRWDTLSDAPPHEISGKTRLAAPRAELRATLKRLCLQKHNAELLTRAEAAFAEGANHFWLDLQYYAFMALEYAGDTQAAAREAIATDCTLLLQRVPGLEHLSFTDGTPFADSTTLEWIHRHATPFDPNQVSGPALPMLSDADTDWASIETQALDLAQQQGLDDALAWLQTLPGYDTARQRCLRQLIMARVAERSERMDIAIHLLDALNLTAEHHQLAQWEPALAFELKHRLLRALALRSSRKDADKAALALRIDALLGQLTAIDPARAVLIT